MSQAALEVHGLSKRYRRVAALRDVSFAVAPGEIFGYLGPNGAGKTTTLRIAVGLVRPDAGSARLLGLDARRPASRVRAGYLPGDLRLPGSLTPRAFLDHVARGRRTRPPVLRERLIDVLGLEPRDLARRIKTLSHGTRQKVGLAAALQHDPDLLLLDEPSGGLDPLVQRRLREFLVERARAGRAVLLSSHVLSEVEAICDRIGVLREGRLLAVETVAALRARVVRRALVRWPGEPPAGLADLPGVERVERRGREVTLWVRGEGRALLEWVARAPFEHFVFPEPELEDAFLSFYREGGDGGA